MARARLKRLLLAVLRSDVTAQFNEGQWLTRCLHCRTRHVLDAEGKPLTAVTLEHIVPQAWFGRRAAARLCAGLEGPDDPRNLGIACARCNHDKGKGPDVRGPTDPVALRLVTRLLALRQASMGLVATESADQ